MCASPLALPPGRSAPTHEHAIAPPTQVQKAFEAVLTDADIMEAKANAVNTQLSQRLRDCVFAALDDFMTLRR